MKGIIQVLLMVVLFELESSVLLVRKVDEQKEIIYAPVKFSSLLYLKTYTIPYQNFTYTNNGGTMFPNRIDDLFNDSENNLFVSDSQNTANFKNRIYVQFSTKVTLNKILYQTSDVFGYPTTLTIRLKEGKNSSSIKALIFKSKPTTDKVIFEFDEDILCDKVQLEFTEVPGTYITGSKIKFFLAEDPNLKRIEKLFSDSYMLYVNQRFKTVLDIENLRSKVIDFINYESGLKDTLDRAVQVLEGTIKFDKKRHFSTNPEKDSGNLIYQYGNIKQHCAFQLQFLLNVEFKQTTGILGTKGEKFKIFVKTRKIENLPQIVFTQFNEIDSSFHQHFQLAPGLNEFTLPDYWIEGPIYIENSNIPSEQPFDISLYIEGGIFFPVFKKGSSEEKYLSFLKSYYDSPEGKYNFTEIEGDFSLQTIPLNIAYNSFIKESFSPQRSVSSCDDKIKAILKFEGIKFDKKEKHYSLLNQHIQFHFRFNEVVGAYAPPYPDNYNIKIYNNKSVTTLIHSEDLGWDYAKAIGMITDITYQWVNNFTLYMVPKFEESLRNTSVIEGDYNSIFDELTSDLSQDGKYWSRHNNNYIALWLIESYLPGFWGKFSNLFRYQSEAFKRITSAEIFVYYSSLATGLDLRYYYKRLGFFIYENEGIFGDSQESQEFQDLMNEAINDNKIKTNIEPKLWYYDEKQYNIRVKEENLTIYSAKDTVNIISIKRLNYNSTSYMFKLILPNPKNSTLHLGYEIKRKIGKEEPTIVAFSRHLEWEDPQTYDNYTFPSYSIRAYDRSLNFTKEGESLSFVKYPNCKIGNNFFHSIKEAVLFAKENDVIELITNITETRIEVTKSIEIKSDSSANLKVIKRENNDVIFSVSSGATLKITDPKIIIDGLNYMQTTSAFTVESKSQLILSNVIIKNNHNIHNGGAIFLNPKAKLTISNVTFLKNSAKKGGAIYCSKDAEMEDTSSKYIENNAEKGGGVYLKCTSKLDKSTFLLNSATKGGGAYLVGRTIMTSLDVRPNRAEKGWGIYINSTSLNDVVLVSNSKFFPSEAETDSFEEDAQIKIKDWESTENAHYSTIFIQRGHLKIIGDSVPIILLENSELISIKEGDSSEISIQAKNIIVQLKAKKKKETQIGNDIITLIDLDKNKRRYFVNMKNYFIIRYILDGVTWQEEENKYLSFTDESGNEYLEDEEVRLRNSETLTMQKREKLSVTIKIGDEASIQYYRKGDNYTFPDIERTSVPSSKWFFGWSVGEVIYQKKEVIPLSKSIVVEAQFKYIEPQHAITYVPDTINLNFDYNTRTRIVRSSREEVENPEDIDENFIPIENSKEVVSSPPSQKLVLKILLVLLFILLFLVLVILVVARLVCLKKISYYLNETIDKNSNKNKEENDKENNETMLQLQSISLPKIELSQ